MGQFTYCCGLDGRAAVMLIAIVDAILGLIFFLMSTLALADLRKVSDLIERDISSTEQNPNDYSVQLGINEFTHIHGQVVVVLLGSLVSLFLGMGLYFGVHKDWDCPIKAWLINATIDVLLSLISIIVLVAVTSRVGFLFLLLFVGIRFYEMFVVFNFLRLTRFTNPPRITMSRTSSTERLYSV